MFAVVLAVVLPVVITVAVGFLWTRYGYPLNSKELTALIADVATSTRTAQVSRDAEAVVHSSDVDAQDSVSGVNLDEEAANMLRYQQAYAAAAQIIAVANEMFDTLLNAVRR